MWETRVPESMAALPGRRHVCADTDDYTDEERATEYQKLAAMRDYYYRNKDQMLAQRKLAKELRSLPKTYPNDPIVAAMKAAHAAGLSIERIAKAAGMDPRTVRGMVKC